MSFDTSDWLFIARFRISTEVVYLGTLGREREEGGKRGRKMSERGTERWGRERERRGRGWVGAEKGTRGKREKEGEGKREGGSEGGGGNGRGEKERETERKYALVRVCVCVCLCVCVCERVCVSHMLVCTIVPWLKRERAQTGADWIQHVNLVRYRTSDNLLYSNGTMLKQTIRPIRQICANNASNHVMELEIT